MQKWGNSLGVRIPRGLADELGLGAGTEISLTAKDGELVLRPAVPSRLPWLDHSASTTAASGGSGAWSPADRAAGLL